MIKCGDKLEGKPQCILYSKDGKKVLGRFPYSKHKDEKGAKAAAHKREGQVQFFKKKHQSLLDALEAFGAPVVLKYLLDKAADCEACQEVVKSYVEKAQGEPAEEPEGEEVEKAEKGKGWTPPPKGWTPTSIQKYWKAMGSSVTKCIAKAKGHVDDPAKFCASLKDKVTGTTKWRGKEKKSFDELAEEALLILVQKDEETDVDVDLAQLEAWLKEADVAEPPATEEPTPEPEPEPEPETPPEEPPPEPEPEPGPESAEELPNDFHTFLLRDHAERQAGVVAMLGEGEEEVE